MVVRMGAMQQRLKEWSKILPLGGGRWEGGFHAQIQRILNATVERKDGVKVQLKESLLFIIVCLRHDHLDIRVGGVSYVGRWQEHKPLIWNESSHEEIWGENASLQTGLFDDIIGK